MNNSDNIINICFASDNGYAEHLLVAIYSLIYNLDKRKHAYIYILDGGMNKESVNKIRSIENEFNNLEIEFIQVVDKKYDTFPALHLSKEMYFRIGIQEILKDLDKVLYLDCDIIINGDISAIFSYNIDNYAVGAPDDIGTFFYYRDVLNIPPPNEYFNSGVLFMNLEYFRKNGLSEEIFGYILNHNLITGDQDAINAILWNKRLRLPLKYNALDRVFIGPKNKQFSEGEITEARESPVVIHYAGSKPWKKYCTHPLKEKYYKYRQISGLDPIKFDNKLELRLLTKNVVWLLGVYLLNIIPRNYYYYIVFKPKQFLGKLFG